MSKQTTRRAVLAGAIATPVALALPAVTQAQPTTAAEKKIRALSREYWRLNRKEKEALREQLEAEKTAPKDEMPDMPQDPRRVSAGLSAETKEAFATMTVNEYCSLSEDHPLRKCYAEEHEQYERAYTEYLKKSAAFKEKYGITQAANNTAEVSAARWQAYDEVISTRADTVAGRQIKARIIRHVVLSDLGENDDGFVSEPLASMIDDILAAA